ncbi:hypothetical protein ACJJTC_014960 [Scirpophaga incertulas]
MDYHKTGIPGGSNYKVVTREYLFNKMQQPELHTFDEKVDYLANYLLTSDNFNEEQLKVLKHKISHFKSDLKKRWLKANRILDKFITANATWLQGTFEITIVPLPQKRAGRPSKPFDELSDRNKRKKTSDLRSTVSQFCEEVFESRLQCRRYKSPSTIV